MKIFKIWQWFEITHKNNHLLLCFVPRGAADDILGTAEGVIEALNKAKEAQDAAQIAIDKADKDATDADSDITMVSIHRQSLCLIGLLSSAAYTW